MSDIATFPSEGVVLRRVLELMMTPPLVAERERLFTSAMRAEATMAYFLLDTRPRNNVETFITYTLGRLLRQLNRYTEQHQVEYQGQVRGRIVWTATFKSRYTQSNDPTRYVCREVRHQYDTPQNQLLKYMVERLDNCLKTIPKALRMGGCYSPGSGGRGTSNSAIRLERMEVALNNFQRHARLREVTLPLYIEELHLARTETARTEEYAELARIYRRYQEFIESPTWEQLMTVGKRVLLLPGNPEADGERWIQLAVNILRS